MNAFIGKYELQYDIELDRSYFTLYVNNENNEIHVIDLRKVGTMGVAGNIGVDFFNGIIRELPYVFKARLTPNAGAIKYFWVGSENTAYQFDYHTEKSKPYSDLEHYTHTKLPITLGGMIRDERS
jgi:hypothetical protein